MEIYGRFLVVLGAGALAAGLVGGYQLRAADAAARAPAAGWGKAIVLRGPSGSPAAGISTMSCSSPGNCGAGGWFSDARGEEAAVVSQVRGTWGRVQVVPGLNNRKGYTNVAYVSAVSCPSTGNCVAVGSYSDTSLRRQVFIIKQRRGTWGKPMAVPGLVGLNTGKPGAGAGGLSCPSIGNCSATGSYTTKSGQSLPFVVSEVHGIWGHAIEVPGFAALPGLFKVKGTYGASLGPISCPSAGNCSAAGSYPVDGSVSNHQVFVVSEVHGTWGSALQVPGTAALNTGLYAAVNSISCPSPGDCGAGGTYALSDGSNEAFVVNQVHGTWGKAIEVPGTARLNFGGGAQVSSISCPSAGNCSAGGIYADKGLSGTFSNGQAFVVSEVNGSWNRAKPVPGVPRLNKGDDASLVSISCPTTGNCAAGGFYSPGLDFYGHPAMQAFVVSQVHGAWGKALEVPGTGALNTGGFATVGVVSCTAPGKCSAAGSFDNNGFKTFVVTKS